MPVAVVSLVDTDRVWYKSVHGHLARREIARLPGLCAAAIGHDGTYVVENARADPRTQEHPLVAGAASASSSTSACRSAPTTATSSACSPAWTAARAASARSELRLLETLAAIVMDEIELRRSAAQISRLSEALAEPAPTSSAGRASIR